MNDTTTPTWTPKLEAGVVFPVQGLVKHLAQIKDPRNARGRRYSLVTLLVLLILAKLGGEDTLKGMAEWVHVRQERLIALLGLERADVPHQTTYARVIARLDVEEVDRVLGEFFRQVVARQDGHQVTLILDGKVLRGTIPPGETQGVHLLAAYNPEQGVVLMQVEVEGQANELVVAPRVLEMLDLRGCVVTGDALFAQREVCAQIVAQGGDYLFPVKDNQPTLREDIAIMFTPPPVTPGHSAAFPEGSASSTNKGHGRIESRYLTTSTQLNTFLDWPHVGQVFRLQRVVQDVRTGRLSYQVVFGVTSLSPEHASPDRLLSLLRTHWHIENRLHFVRDVSFHEDASTIRHTPTQRILAALNNLAIGLIRRCPDFRYVPEARRFFAVHLDQAFQLLL